ncbi:MAG: FAD-dependent oxidoreductase, partial [Actinomycetota bacterium]
MFRDARTVSDGEVLDCDVCIVGTGAAGVTCAVELRDAGLRVTVLESGGLKPDAATDSLYGIESAELPVPESSRQRFFGGTTNSWWGKVALLDPGDFARRDWVDGSGWPIDRSDLDPFYRRACELLGLPDLTEFAPAPSTVSRDALLDDGALEAKSFFWKDPVNFGELYRRRAAGAPNVTTLLNANATELLLDESGRMDRVAVATLNGRRFHVKARAAIVACGGIENARLLLNSTSDRPAGVGNEFDQVGRHYMDHPRGPSGIVETLDAIGGLLPAYWSGKRHRSVRYRVGVSLSARAQAETRSLNSYVNLSPVYGGGVGGGVGAIRDLYRKGPAALRNRATRRALLTGVPDIVRYFRFKRYGRGRMRALTVENYMEQEPRASNRVTRSDRRDALGDPLARVSWSLSELDRHTVRTLHAALDAELRARSIGRVTGPIMSGDGIEWPVANDAAHHMGTTRMGTDPRSSVVDPECRVHGIENLYIAGSSVFPTGGAANPTLTIIALAIRLAGHVRS